ncbi:MAG: hypothetical protein PHD03_00370 [Bacilli bacterium]|nr:hypothetical protein [Bacilli bacterium]MDD4406645.1 hypothetical protein [Bacilli bacterium]
MNQELNKRLKIILSVIFIIILLILILYFFNQFLKLNIYEEVERTTTTIKTTKKVDYDFIELTNDKKIFFNNYLNNIFISKAFNNAIEKNYKVYNINLIQSEISKFKFIYTYLKLKNAEENITFEKINEYSNKFFKTNLYQENLNIFLQEQSYYYEFNNEELDFCLKVNSEKDNILFIDMVKKETGICNNDALYYDKNLIVNQIKLEYLLIDEEMIYYSFMIVK